MSRCGSRQASIRHKSILFFKHDGQNVFNNEMSYTRTNWGADERVDTLVSNSRVKPIIIVGIWNTKLRFNEYMPDECITPEGLKEVQGYLSGQSLLSEE